MGCRACKHIDRSGRILFLGPKESGKTSALYFLKTGAPVTTVPTHGYNRERLVMGRNEYDVYEIGAAVDERRDCLHLMTNVAAVVFFIDCSLGEKGLELGLKRLEIMLAEKALHRCPVAIVANKQDLCERPNQLHIKGQLKLLDCMTLRYWNVFPCTGRTGEGLNLVLKWVDENIGKFKKEKKVKGRIKLRSSNQRNAKKSTK